MGELAAPDWRLEDPAVRRLGPIGLLRRLGQAARPVLAIVREAAPRSAVTILVLQVAAGVAAATGLLATTGVLAELLSAGPTADRIAAALPGLALVVAAFGARGALDAGTSFAQARLVPAVRRAAEERLYAASVRVELAAFDDSGFYDRLHRARDRAVPHIERAAENLVELIGAAFALAAATTSVGLLHPALLPVLLLGVVPEGWAVLRAARVEFANMTVTATLARRVWTIADLATRRESAAEIRAFQAQGFVLDDYRRAADALQAQEVRVGLAQARTRATGRAMAGVGIAITYAALALLLNLGWVALAVAGTAVIAIRASVAALTRLVVAGNRIVEQALYVSDYQGFLVDSAARTPSASGAPVASGPDCYSVADVTFRYPGTDEPALHRVSLTIPAGQTVAFVGENGSGKTTLAKLIAGLYRPGSGAIRWDGTDIRDLDPADLAAQVVMVLQEPVRWPTTARANIRLGRPDRPDPDDAALLLAARHSRADEVVDRLPKRWETLLSKLFTGGQELSGGQWQRMAIARGLYRDAPLLIWDEPTAPLDARAEAAVYESLRQLAAGRTVILITHRLASVRHADQIFLLHGGELVEHGTHEELLAADLRYAELYAIQARIYAPDAVVPR
ncbi:ABC-type multidrug transport system fused ATPase/permease subunit [Allocatelliglobosispora scoriae]|uniref:ABC-type multidrug transport system fused ATPase/permease subunit n=1 Tax=Allocatelliglobosispora scoriae TaxID=643052 RepID=A0A841BPE6_9ACTN|nr:ATP-binding cassette domain-containing protein [Allocatelliglobosispora scoriae]MBB5869059.1 ABC-type multidrug transport system fused ATPase/permease subunit [Allocatelliglobosispora scoriae]